jgi:hypothetical protein
MGEDAHRNLDENRFALLLDTMKLRLDRGENTGILPDLHELVHRWPLCEHLDPLLMTALYRAGRLADAVEAFKSVRRRSRTWPMRRWSTTPTSTASRRCGSTSSNRFRGRVV